MILTKQKLQKLLKDIDTGRIIIYPSTGGDYVLINLVNSIVEYINKDLVEKLIKEEIIFPFLAYTLDRDKLKEKGGRKTS